MKILQPFYYDDFKCIANKCKDNCCIGWKVTIEKEIFVKYRKIKGEFGRDLNANIKRNRTSKDESSYGQMILTEENRCYFLNSDNLCNMYINKGPNYLGNICTVYPRQIYDYGHLIERNLTLSCPSVAEVLVNSEEMFCFVMKEETINEFEKKGISKIKCDTDLFNLLWEGRSFSIEIAQFREIPLWKRLIFIKLAEERLQKLINSEDYIRVDEVIEKLRNEITKQSVIDSLDKITEVDNTVKINIIMSILQLRINNGVANKTFRKVLTDIYEFIKNDDNKDMQLVIQEKETEFMKYFKNRDYILENYIVYNLYSMYMKSLITKDLNKEITRLMISYSIIKLALMSTWMKNNSKLTNEDVIDVLYSFSRALEHNEHFIESLYSKIKDAGYDSMAYLATIVY